MRIAASAVSLSASREYTRVESTTERLRFWAGGAAAASWGERISREPVREKESPSQAGEVCGCKPDLARLKVLVEKIVEMATGKRIRIRIPVLPDRGADANPASSPTRDAATVSRGWGLEYDSTHYIKESERSSFSAVGVIRTSDGKEVAFRLELDMRREFESLESVRIRMGDAPVSDPLVVNFEGTAAQLSGLRFSFDLDADGTADSIPLLAPGNGFVALDLDGDGVIENGGELFGPRTGDGFEELSTYDKDGNHWIDENDPVFFDLRIWMRNEREDRLLTLQEAGIGALFLGRTATPFTLTRPDNQALGYIRSSGFYLREDGSPGPMQQLDLSM